MPLTKRQIVRLSKAIDPTHVENKRGMAYMAQHEVRAELTRIFGYGNWDTQVESMDLIYEDQYQKDGKTYYLACYKAAVRLNIRDYDGNLVCSFLEYHAEENAPLPNRGEAHAMAITSVESYALRRAAIGLGDRMGLGLYNKGSQAPLVGGSMQLTDADSPQFLEGTPEPPLSTPETAETTDYVGQAMLAEKSADVLKIWRDAKTAFGPKPTDEQRQTLATVADIGAKLKAIEDPEAAAETALAKGFKS